MDPDDWLRIASIAVLAFFLLALSLAETAAFTQKRRFLAMRPSGPRALLGLALHPREVSFTLMLLKGTSLAGIAALLLLSLDSLSTGVRLALSVAGSSALFLLTAWVAPRVSGVIPTFLWHGLGFMLSYLAQAFRPIASVVSGHGEVKHKANDHKDHWPVSETDDAPELEPAQQEMILSILELDKTTAREIMTHRMDIAAVESTATLDTVIQAMLEEGHSRIPVFEDTIDTIIGIVYARDLLEVSRAGTPWPGLAALARPAYFVPEYKKLNELLEEFQRGRVQIAIVVDEYGVTAGLVTIEDLLEEIVGEIADEFSKGGPQFEKVRAGEYVMEAAVDIDTLNHLLGSTIQAEDFETVAGLVLQRLGRMAAPGDAIEVDGLRIEVLTTVGRRMRKLRVTRPSQEPVA